MTYNELDRIARQLEAIEGRFEELSIRITLPEVIADSALFTKLIREHADMEELNRVAVEFRKLNEEIEAAKELMEDPDHHAGPEYLLVQFCRSLHRPSLLLQRDSYRSAVSSG